MFSRYIMDERTIVCPDLKWMWYWYYFYVLIKFNLRNNLLIMGIFFRELSIINISRAIGKTDLNASSEYNEIFFC